MMVNRLLIIFVLLVTGVSHTLATPLPENMKMVGQAELKVLWFRVYSARLENTDGRYVSMAMPLLLHLHYHRDISRQQLLDETQSQWQRAAIDPQQQSQWLSSLAQLWPDIRQHDSLSFYQDSQGDGHFYHNRRYIGSIHERRFSQAFLAIWLADNSDFPQLTRALTGRR
ncbi:hypothetical protein Q4488_08050 [Amphritea sp. 1_MG-2023]|uniref:chalcone isomerase family protein n=1 Tax=Amphritea sp. 1_MG-2023 TaxID=3062670 RepID=UPI0026E390D7|nr:chalcone isomerase family protein [Amphritea sp. 1_MG-2023]MDO6563334.1 hypothetical protein [Amphritea sp. 1_MG-2023]